MIRISIYSVQGLVQKIGAGEHCCSTQGDLFFCFMNRIVICLIVLWSSVRNSIEIRGHISWANQRVWLASKFRTRGGTLALWPNLDQLLNLVVRGISRTQRFCSCSGNELKSALATDVLVMNSHQVKYWSEVKWIMVVWVLHNVIKCTDYFLWIMAQVTHLNILEEHEHG